MFSQFSENESLLSRVLVPSPENGKRQERDGGSKRTKGIFLPSDPEQCRSTQIHKGRLRPFFGCLADYTTGDSSANLCGFQPFWPVLARSFQRISSQWKETSVIVKRHFNRSESGIEKNLGMVSFKCNREKEKTRARSSRFILKTGRKICRKSTSSLPQTLLKRLAARKISSPHITDRPVFALVWRMNSLRMMKPLKTWTA